MPSHEEFSITIVEMFPSEQFTNLGLHGKLIEIHRLLHDGQPQVANKQLYPIKFGPDSPELSWEQRRFLVWLLMNHDYPLDHPLEPLTNTDETV